MSGQAPQDSTTLSGKPPPPACGRSLANENPALGRETVPGSQDLPPHAPISSTTCEPGAPGGGLAPLEATLEGGGAIPTH